MEHLRSRVASFAVAISLAASTLACGGNEKKTANKPGDGETMDGTPGAFVVPQVDASLCNTEGKRVETFDLNRDNKPDVWKLYAVLEEGGTDVEVLTCKQIDFDHDGVKDYVVTFKETGEMAAEEADLTFDGRFDARHHFDEKTGKVYLIERDTDFDKKPDVWEKFDSAGLIESVRRDTNADGKPDIWEQYVEGKLLAILYDDDFDNKVDRKEQLGVKAPVATPPPAPNLEGDAPAPANGAPAPTDSAPAPTESAPAPTESAPAPTNG